MQALPSTEGTEESTSQAGCPCGSRPPPSRRPRRARPGEGRASESARLLCARESGIGAGGQDFPGLAYRLDRLSRARWSSPARIGAFGAHRGPGEDGFRVVDVWESEEAAQRFGEKLVPVLQEVGIQAKPELSRAHVCVDLRRREGVTCPPPAQVLALSV